MRMYIAVLDEFPDYMAPTLVAHAVLGAHIKFSERYEDEEWRYGEPCYPQYINWLEGSFKKCVVRVNQKEFDKISTLDSVHIAYEKTTLGSRNSCVVVCPRKENPNVLKFAKLWKPKLEDALQ